MGSAVPTLRVGLLLTTTGAAAACLTITSADVSGEGKLPSTTLATGTLLFSWELRGSGASLLGIGVMLLEGRFLEVGKALDLVVSFKLGDDLEEWQVGAAGELPPVAAALAKNPRMLCCLPVETNGGFFDVAAALAGVRAATPDCSPIFAL